MKSQGKERGESDDITILWFSANYKVTTAYCERSDWAPHIIGWNGSNDQLCSVFTCVGAAQTVLQNTAQLTFNVRTVKTEWVWPVASWVAGNQRRQAGRQHADHWPVLSFLACQYSPMCTTAWITITLFPPNSSGKMSSPTSWKLNIILDLKTLKISCRFEDLLGVQFWQGPHYILVFLILSSPEHVDKLLKHSRHVDDEQSGILNQQLVFHGVGILSISN